MRIRRIVFVLIGGIFLYSCSTSKAIENLDPPCPSCKIERVKTGKWKVYTEIEINAPIDSVWSVLTDFEKMPSWSSRFQGIDGVFKNGEAITAKFKSDPEKDELTTYQHNIIVNDYSFGWQGDVFALGMRDAHYYQLVELEANKTLMIQSDQSNSGMTWLLGKTVSKIMLEGYNTFNTELKSTVEKAD